MDSLLNVKVSIITCQHNIQWNVDFEIKETSITHSDGHTSISKTPKVTGKGQQYFINKF